MCRTARFFNSGFEAAIPGDEAQRCQPLLIILDQLQRRAFERSRQFRSSKRNWSGASEAEQNYE
ncbi:MAG: hypothetical protein EBZ49_02315 [Proteobacteria bacterium]|nr:hypothetical protein [Pseudomonadota bacterium]